MRSGPCSLPSARCSLGGSRATCISRWGSIRRGPFTALFGAALDGPIFVLLALTLIVFPDGRLPSPSWRPTVVLAASSIVAIVLGYVVYPGPLPIYPAYESPFGVNDAPGDALIVAGYLAMLLVLAAGALALTTRWRRGQAAERAQIKWVVAAGVLVAVAEGINVLTFDPTHPNSIPSVTFGSVIVTIPLSIGVAIMRYRLYDIDRLISRTIGWAVVTGVLVGTFALLIIGSQAVLQSATGGDTIAVAVSTLVVAGLFAPVRSRVQRGVDHRFDRARYDGERTIEALAGRLRSDHELSTVCAEITRTADAAVRPAQVGIWLRDPSR